MSPSTTTCINVIERDKMESIACGYYQGDITRASTFGTQSVRSGYSVVVCVLLRITKLEENRKCIRN
jgi:hypothetical protein